MGEEQIWTKQGSRFQLPRLPRQFRAVTSVGVVSLSLVGLLAVPAGSPPPPPAVAAPTVSVPPPPDVTYCAVTGAAGYPAFEDAPRSTARLIAYAARDGIVEYSVDQKAETKILTGNNCAFQSARFIDDHTLAVVESTSIWIVDTVIGQVSEQPMVPNGSTVMAFAVAPFSPDGSLLAALSFDSKSPSIMTLTVSAPYWPNLAFSKRLRWTCSCDPFVLTYLQWSRDGDLLAVAVPGDSGASVMVFGRDGHQLGKAFTGEMPRWIGATHNLAIKRDDFLPSHFDEVTTDGKLVRHLFITDHYVSTSSISPDGSKIAFNDDESAQTAVYDFKSNAVKMYGKMEMFPVWLSNDSFAVSKVALCGCDGAPSAYEPSGPASVISVRSGTRHPLGPLRTDNADVWF